MIHASVAFMNRRGLLAVGIGLFVASCAEGPKPVVLTPEGYKVEIIQGEPPRERYDFVAEMRGEGSSTDLTAALAYARNHAKNVAASVQATHVVIDHTVQGREESYGTVTHKVNLVCRAFRLKPGAKP